MCAITAQFRRTFSPAWHLAAATSVCSKRALQQVVWDERGSVTESWVSAQERRCPSQAGSPVRLAASDASAVEHHLLPATDLCHAYPLHLVLLRLHQDTGWRSLDDELCVLVQLQAFTPLLHGLRHLQVHGLA